MTTLDDAADGSLDAMLDENYCSRCGVVDLVCAAATARPIVGSQDVDYQRCLYRVSVYARHEHGYFVGRGSPWRSVF